MKISFDNEQMYRLMQLVYAGELLINGGRRLPLGEFSSVAREAYRQYCERCGRGKSALGRITAEKCASIGYLGDPASDLADLLYDSLVPVLGDFLTEV